MPLFHHCRPLDHVHFGVMTHAPCYSDPDWRGAYLWLERQVGFYPIFLSVGNAKEDIWDTAYQDNWRVVFRSFQGGIRSNHYRAKGEFPNYVLFSFDLVEGVFIDSVWWNFALSAEVRDYHLTQYEKRLILKPSWPKSRWLRYALLHPGGVQLVVPRLFLPDASRVWVRNKETRARLEGMGFRNVWVKRIPVPRY